MTPSEKTACEDIMQASQLALTTIDDLIEQLPYLPDDLAEKINQTKTAITLSRADLLRYMEGSRK